MDDQNIRSEYNEPSSGQPDGEVPVSGDQCTDSSQTREMEMLTDAERIELEEAATKTQAAFRGYLVTSVAEISYKIMSSRMVLHNFFLHFSCLFCIL